MSNIIMKFANDDQYKRFLSDIKEEVKSEVLKEMQGRLPKSRGWERVRAQIEEKLRGEYNGNCGQWYTNQQGLYATFRLAFQVNAIRDLSSKDNDKIQDFHDELFSLIDKYRELNSL